MKKQIKLMSSPKSEAQHQVNVMRWALIVRDKYPVLKLLYATPNGGRRDPIEAKHLKEQGVKPGIPDLFLPVARKDYHGLYIEMKTETGRESAEQIWWREQLTEQGYFVEVCHGWESAVRVIEWYMYDGREV